MGIAEIIRRLQRRLQFLQGRIAASGGASYDRAEASALHHAIIRLEQFNILVPPNGAGGLIECAKKNPEVKQLVQKLRELELSKGKRLQGGLWVEK